MAEADNCDTHYTITISSPINLSSYSSSTLEFARFVDSSLDSGEYLKVKVGNNGNYDPIFYWTHGNGDTDEWHHETFDLSSYLSSDFNLRFITSMSSSNEDVGIDNIVINVDSNSECVLTINSSLIGTSRIDTNWNECEGADRYYIYTNENGQGDRIHRVSSSTSHTLSVDEGSSYVVKVKAYYSSDETFTDLFYGPTITVPVLDRTAAIITVPDDITVNASSASGSVVTYTASAYDANDGTISVDCSPSSGSNFEVGTTTVTCTATDAAGNRSVNTFNVIMSPYSPSCEIGNRDYEGDVCITVHSDNSLWTFLNQPGILGDPELFGGSAISLYEFPIPIPGTGTVAIVIEKNGENYLITNDHNVNAADSNSNHIKIHTWSHPLGIQIGEIADRSFVSESHIATSPIDVASIRITSDIITNHVNTIRHDGNTYNVTQFGGIENIGIDQIFMSGAITESDGYVAYQNVTAHINYADGPSYSVLTNQIVGTYNSNQGDSGAPVFSINGSEATLLGIHSGAGCRIILNGDVMNICVESGSYMAIFGTWEEMANTLGIN